MREKIIKLLETTECAKETISIAQTFLDTIYNAMPPEERQETENYFKQYMELIDAEMDKLMEKYIDVYAEMYNEADIDALLAFEESEIGKKHRQLRPQMSTKMYNVANEFAQEILAKIEIDKSSHVSSTDPALLN